MKLILNWLKSNVITVVAVVFAIVALVGVYVVRGQGQSFRDELLKRAREVDRINQFANYTVTLPSQDPQGPEQSLTLCINEPAVKQVERLFGRMSDEQSNIMLVALQFNQGDHRPLLDRLFPDTTDAGLPFDAKEEYRRAFREMLSSYSADSRYPRLDAGEPPTSDEIGEAIEKATQAYLNSFYPPKQERELSEADQNALREKRKEKLLNLLRRRAQMIHLYAQTDMTLAGFPFQVSPWSGPGEKPTMEQLWEGQMSLWIQQDVAAAIELTNAVDDPQSSVMTAPVKRLLSVEVFPGSVGLNGNRGAVNIAVNTSSAGGSTAQRGSSDSSGGGSDGGYDFGYGGYADMTEDFSSEGGISSDFSITPTGRTSNSLYDVWHARVSVIVDSQRLPEFLDNLAQVNFITALRIELTDVDEYDALREGYVYGSGDTVQADIWLETLWLRDWTTKLMPAAIRSELGIATVDAEAAGETESEEAY